MVSIIIPTYEMQGRGEYMLDELLKSIYMQTFKDYEIIVSDNSMNTCIRDYCIYQNVTYVENEKKDNPAANFNNGIKHAKGDVIKPMCQDDYFTDKDTLGEIANCEGWAVFQSTDHKPYYNENIRRLREGENTYGSPSAVAWKSTGIRFNERLLWLMDCELYTRLIGIHGQPVLIDKVVGIRHWQGQLTYQAGGNRRITDLQYIQALHGSN